MPTSPERLDTTTPRIRDTRIPGSGEPLPPEFTDEEWLAGATQEFAPFLDKADDDWRDFNLSEDVIWERRYNDAEQREQDRALWNAMSLSDRYAAMFAHVAEDLGLSPVELERSDAVVRMLAWRMMNASHPCGRARPNDGADNLLPQHVANGGIIITNDGALLGAIEASGTTQGPWIRHVDEALQQPAPDLHAVGARRDGSASRVRPNERQSNTDRRRAMGRPRSRARSCDVSCRGGA